MGGEALFRTGGRCHHRGVGMHMIVRQDLAAVFAGLIHEVVAGSRDDHIFTYRANCIRGAGCIGGIMAVRQLVAAGRQADGTGLCVGTGGFHPGVSQCGAGSRTAASTGLGCLTGSINPAVAQCGTARRTAASTGLGCLTGGFLPVMVQSLNRQFILRGFNLAFGIHKVAAADAAFVAIFHTGIGTGCPYSRHRFELVALYGLRHILTYGTVLCRMTGSTLPIVGMRLQIFKGIAAAVSAGTEVVVPIIAPAIGRCMVCQRQLCILQSLVVLECTIQGNCAAVGAQIMGNAAVDRAGRCLLIDESLSRMVTGNGNRAGLGDLAAAILFLNRSGADCGSTGTDSGNIAVFIHLGYRFIGGSPDNRSITGQEVGNIRLAIIGGICLQALVIQFFHKGYGIGHMGTALNGKHQSILLQRHILYEGPASLIAPALLAYTVFYTALAESAIYHQALGSPCGILSLIELMPAFLALTADALLIMGISINCAAGVGIIVAMGLAGRHNFKAAVNYKIAAAAGTNQVGIGVIDMNAGIVVAGLHVGAVDQVDGFRQLIRGSKGLILVHLFRQTGCRIDLFTAISAHLGFLQIVITVQRKIDRYIADDGHDIQTLFSKVFTDILVQVIVGIQNKAHILLQAANNVIVFREHSFITALALDLELQALVCFAVCRNRLGYALVINDREIPGHLVAEVVR